MRDDNPYDEADSMYRAWQAGYDARMTDRPRSECPYNASEKPEGARAWLRGWITANLKQRLGPSDPSDEL